METETSEAVVSEIKTSEAADRADPTEAVTQEAVDSKTETNQADNSADPMETETSEAGLSQTEKSQAVEVVGNQTDLGKRLSFRVYL